MKDIRIYYYENGLKKHSRLKKTYPSIELAKYDITTKITYNKHKYLQWVIVEYTDKYISKIVEVVGLCDKNNDRIF